MSQNRNRIKKPSIPDNSIPKPDIPIKTSNGFNFCTVYHNWIKGTDSFFKKEKFTNMVSDSNEFSNNIVEVLTIMVPKLYAEWDKLFSLGTKNYHCHPVAEDKKGLVKKIAEELHTSTFNEEDLSQSRIQWWYIGFKSNVRVVGLYQIEENIFYPLFIDHHHLIHGNEFYNQPSFGDYNYCPIEVYNT